MPQTPDLAPPERALHPRWPRDERPQGEALPSLITRRERHGPIALSFAQQQFWLLHHIAPDSAAYQHLVSLRLPPTLDVAALQRSMAEIVQRHEAWRTSFPLVDGEVVQRIHNGMFALPFSDLSQFLADDQEAETERLLKHLKRPFNLQEAPPLRAHLVALGARGYHLSIALHHILYDGYALEQVFLPELVALYEAFSAGRPSPLAALPIQYADYALWQRETLDERALAAHLAYWKEHLAGIPAQLNLPTDHLRPPTTHRQAAHVFFTLQPSLREALRALCRREGATLFMAGLAAWGALLSRSTGETDVVIGTPAIGRKQPELEGLLGVCINTLALRLDLSGDPSFRTGLERARQTTLAALDHDELPFEELVKALQPERTLGRNPLFQTMLTIEQAAPPLPAGWALDEPIAPADGAAVDVRLALQDRGDKLGGYIEYDPGLWEAPTIERMARTFQTLLEGITADPDRPLSAVPLLDEAERRQILVEWNATERVYPNDRCVHQLFEDQVDRRPDAIALIAEAGTLTYRELNQRANQLGSFLRKLGVGPDVLVGLCIERSIEMVVGVLGILKAGGAYVPLDPTYPQERLAFMLEDSQVSLVLTSQSCLAALPSPQQRTAFCLDRDWSQLLLEPGENLAGGAAARNLAYVMYTSGSTGQPKGVEIQHFNIVRLVCGVEYADLDAPTTLHVSPISFDAATFEIWGALLNGGRCVLYPERIPTPQGIGEAIERHHVSTVFLTTALFNAVIDEAPEALKGARQVMTGGEALSVAHIHRALQQLPTTQLINAYGPTESTTYTTCYVIPRSFDVTRRSVPIGRPIANTQVYVLDAQLQPVPIGVPGELYIGGDGLARGYLRRPDLTAERFIRHPFSRDPDARLYKTGDLVRWLESGNLEYLGRLDDQVKIRGFRIEPGEIETVLSQHPAVREAVVLAVPFFTNEKRLVAYLTPKQEGEWLASDELRGFLRERLPEYMVPSALVWLACLPKTPIGKIDRRNLPPPVWDEPASQPSIAPRTPTEQWLASIWSAVLGREQLSIFDNFFELGGSSLLATRLIARLSHTLNSTLKVSWIFRYPTIASLAVALDDAFPHAQMHAGLSHHPDSVGGSTPGGSEMPALPETVTVETRPLLSLMLSGALPPVEAVALGYVSDALSRHAVREQLFQGLPVLTSVLSTPFGHIGVITLPLTAQELYSDQEHLVRLCGQARTMAKAIGARAMSLTGLLPSATNYGQSLLNDGASAKDVRITTGHATTVAAIILNLARLLREAGRDLASERVACIGLGSVGAASLRLMLARLPHPAELLLCDVYAKASALEALRQEVRDALRFTGPVHLLSAEGLTLPEQVYSASLVIGATNVPDVFDISKAQPGWLGLDDSGPHCYPVARAIERLEIQGDILFTEGGALLSPVPIREVVYAPDAWVQAVGDITPLLASWHRDHLMGCALSGLLLAREADMAPTIGPVALESSRLHLERLQALQFQAAPLHCEHYFLSSARIAAFRARYGQRATEIDQAAKSRSNGRPHFIPC
jgi:amino acid adenylation domain-containing protein